MIEGFIQNCINSFDFEPEQTVIQDLKRALQYRLEGKSPEAVRNTYLKDLEIPQIILFDILANRFPLVLNAQHIVSNAISTTAKGKKHITIIDLGIGRGVQAKRIIETMNSLENIQTLTLIGVEIFKDALDFTIEQLSKIKGALNYQLNFIPIHSSVEEMNVEDLKKHIPENNECILVNASLTLHHIQSTPTRLNVMKKIESFHPNLVTLIEPNTDCHTNDFDQRLKNVYEHFSALYHFINTLNLLPEEKKGLKQFFSTELFDAVALPDEHRFERYSPSTHWLEWGIQSGLSPYDISTSAENIDIENITIENPLIGQVNFKYQQANILGIISLHS